MAILIKYWREFAIAFLAFVAVFMFALVEKKNVSIKQAENERDQLSQALSYQNNEILKNKSAYEKNIIDAKNATNVIETRYKDRIETIYVWGEKNDTSCSDAIRYLNFYGM